MESDEEVEEGPPPHGEEEYHEYVNRESYPSDFDDTEEGG